MNDQVFEIGRQQYDHTGGEMALNPNIPSELFRIIFMGIEFRNQSVKRVFDGKQVKEELIEMISSHSQRFEKYNPYAYALGFVLHSVSQSQSKEAGVAFVLSVLQNKGKTDYYGVPIGDITTITDVIRYSRLVKRLQDNKGSSMPLERAYPSNDDGEEKYDDEYPYNEYGGSMDPDYNSDGEQEY